MPLGVVASLAVIAHEIPQEVGDFAILLDNGYSRSQALTFNLLSSLPTLPGAVIAYFFLGATRDAVPFILALSAASFIYIAIADLVPNLHRGWHEVRANAVNPRAGRHWHHRCFPTRALISNKCRSY